MGATTVAFGALTTPEAEAAAFTRAAFSVAAGPVTMVTAATTGRVITRTVITKASTTLIASTARAVAAPVLHVAAADQAVARGRAPARTARRPTARATPAPPPAPPAPHADAAVAAETSAAPATEKSSGALAPGPARTEEEALLREMLASPQQRERPTQPTKPLFHWTGASGRV